MPDSYFNHKLHETERFIVTPCIGPFEMGHVLVTSKEHHLSVAAMGPEAIPEILTIMQVAIEKSDIYAESLITEHGSTYDEEGGACITHAHVHIIPLHGKHFSALDGQLQLLEISGIEQLHTVQDPYILCMTMNGDRRVYAAYNSHSQMVRKTLCRITGRLDTDWAVQPNIPDVIESISLWT